MRGMRACVRHARAHVCKACKGTRDVRALARGARTQGCEECKGYKGV